MDTEELRKRLARGEDLHTELKAWRPHPEALASALVSFANTDGGVIFLGVEDDKTPAGVPDADEAVRLVDEAARHRCKPPVAILQERAVVDERTVIVVRVSRGDERPYQTAQGVHYVRTAGGKRHASRQELLRLFQAARSLFFDETAVTEAGIADLDAPTLEAYLGSLEPPGRPDPALLANLNLARGDHPTVAALLAFGRAPQRHVAGAYATAARLSGTDLASDVVDQQTLVGPIPTLLEDAGRFLRAHLVKPRTPAGFEPEGLAELPEAALREAVTNALAHRDYTMAGPVRLLLFADRLEIRSPGRLPNTVTVEAMRRGAAHMLRNPTVFSTLLRMGRVTDIGRGVLRMIQQIRQRTGQDLRLTEEAEEFVVALPRPSP